MIRRAILLLAAGAAIACGSEEQPPPDHLEPAVVHGRFRRLRTDSLDTDQRAKIEELQSIGYVSGSRPASSSVGITVYERDRVEQGLNFFSSGHEPGAHLMDMEGKLLHRWQLPMAQVFPDLELPDHNDNQYFWRRAYLFPNGDVLGIFEGIGLFKVDRNSTVLWSLANEAHHDADILPDGKIVVLTRKAHLLPRIHAEEPILEDFITVLDAEGNRLDQVSMIECFENSTYQVRDLHEGELSGDIFHTNGLEVLRPSERYPVPWMRQGLILVSIRNLSMVGVVDFSQKKLVKAFTGDFLLQHDPRALPNGNILIFDNHGRPNASRVLEIDPRTLQPVWQYEGSALRPFFSDTCGTAERLPGGNTLITETDNGRAFEVDQDGEIVWEFYSPFRGGEQGEFIATLFQLKRLPADYCEDWLGKAD